MAGWKLAFRVWIFITALGSLAWGEREKEREGRGWKVPFNSITFNWINLNLHFCMQNQGPCLGKREEGHGRK